MNIVSLSSIREKRMADAMETLMEAISLDIPRDVYVDGEEQIAVFTDKDWARASKLFDVFGLDVPRDINVDHFYDLCYHLQGNLGMDIRLRAKDPALYKSIKFGLEVDRAAYLDALAEGNKEKVRELAKSMKIVESCIPAKE